MVISVSKNNSRHGVEVAPVDVAVRSSTKIEERRDAMEQCKTLVVNGYTGWRLPTNDEMTVMRRFWKKLGMKEGNDSFFQRRVDYYFTNSGVGFQNDGGGGYIGPGPERTPEFGRCWIRAVRNF
jgi:hypothetical protein